VFQLHLWRFRGRIPEKVEGKSAFPILDDKLIRNRSKDPGKWGEIAALSRRQRSAIQFLQPYNTRNDAHALTRRALFEINLLNNIDKHRRLHVVYAALPPT